MSSSAQSIAVTVPISQNFGRFSSDESPLFFARALKALLDASGLNKTDIDGLAVSSFSHAPDPAIALSRSLGLSLRWFGEVNLGGASGGIALNRAARAVAAGDADIVACIAADTNKEEGFKDLVANFSRASRDGVYPYGATGPTSVFALLTQQYMNKYDVGREHVGALCVAQRANAEHVEHAMFREGYSLDDYLNTRMIADPLCLLDCVMPIAGAEAFLVMSAEKAKSLGLSYAKVLSGTEQHNAYPDDPEPLRGGWAKGVDRLFANAGVTHGDIDVVNTYDDYPIISILQLEELGFLEEGKGARFLSDGSLEAQILLKKHNTSGGQLSCGQAGAAGGFLGLVEAIRQLTGQAGGWQRENARHALISGYGMVVYDRCLATCATILSAEDV